MPFCSTFYLFNKQLSFLFSLGLIVHVFIFMFSSCFYPSFTWSILYTRNPSSEKMAKAFFPLNNGIGNSLVDTMASIWHFHCWGVCVINGYVCDVMCSLLKSWRMTLSRSLRKKLSWSFIEGKERKETSIWSVREIQPDLEGELASLWRIMEVAENLEVIATSNLCHTEFGWTPGGQAIACAEWFFGTTL